jgi:hypothetical protein
MMTSYLAKALPALSNEKNTIGINQDPTKKK